MIQPSIITDGNGSIYPSIKQDQAWVVYRCLKEDFDLNGITMILRERGGGGIFLSENDIELIFWNLRLPGNLILLAC